MLKIGDFNDFFDFQNNLTPIMRRIFLDPTYCERILYAPISVVLLNPRDLSDRSRETAGNKATCMFRLRRSAPRESRARLFFR